MKFLQSINILFFAMLSGALLLIPQMVLAHPGLPGYLHGFVGGFLHPLTGIDHIAAMIAVGLWAYQSRAVWAIPLSFVSLMIVGGLLNQFSIALPLSEHLIVGSLFVFGLLVATGARLPTWIGMAIVGTFALFHGYAHVAELQAEQSVVGYVAGFLLATSLVHIAGIFAARFVSRYSKCAVQSAGVLVISAGLICSFGIL